MALYKEIAEDVVAYIEENPEESMRDVADEFRTSERTIRRAKTYFKEHVLDEVESSDSMHEAEMGEDAFDSELVGVEFSVVAASTSIVIVPKSDNLEQATIAKSDERFEKLSNLIWESKGSQEALRTVYKELSKRHAFIKETRGMVEIDSERGGVFFQGKEIASGLGDRIFEACKADDESHLNALIKFTEKLYRNPDREVVFQLFDFLQACDIDINEEGDVVCYKKVRSNYKDCHSGTIDNSVGQTPWIPRWEVEKNPRVTCSYGLHVCSKNYLSCYVGDRVMRVIVDPEDFVSIPEDYYSGESGNMRAKARVCKYHVVEEITNKM